MGLAKLRRLPSIPWHLGSPLFLIPSYGNVWSTSLLARIFLSIELRFRELGLTWRPLLTPTAEVSSRFIAIDDGCFDHRSTW